MQIKIKARMSSGKYNLMILQCMNKTGTSQVGVISKAQKAQNIFFGKKLEIFEKKIFFGKCPVVPKNVKGGTLFDL